MKKIILVALIFAVVGGTAFSFDVHSFPSNINKGDFLLSPMFILGGYGISIGGFSGEGGLAFGAIFAADYALPIPFALTVGGELGIVGSSASDFDGLAIPILARASWHPNFEVPNLDPYVTVKMGYSACTIENFNGGFSFGFNVGTRYFFNPMIGVFGELGYNRYSMGSWDLGYEFGKWEFYSYSWLHAGVTFRFGKSGGSDGVKKTSSKAEYMLVNADTLNIRKGPSADSELVVQLKRNDRVQILDSSGQWYKVRFGKTEGYVNSNYLIKEK